MKDSAVTQRKITFLNSKISFGNYQSFIDRILDLAKKNISAYVCVMNVHMLVEAYFDNTFAKIVNDADIVTPDGMPLVFGLNGLYNINQERVAGMDLMQSLLIGAQRQKTSVYFYGSTNDVLETIIERCKEEYPKLKVAGLFSPPFRPLTKVEQDCIIEKINSSNAGIVLVALGCPKQEKWMATMKGNVNAVMIGLGGAFPVFAGTQSRAPLWMQKYSLEWLYRLFQEPRRLWKRYFVTNSIFVYLFLKEYISIKLFKQIPDSYEIHLAQGINKA
ncbi:WecB/TagA/CpsF family glycosyltransferase [Dyadobacter psychrophilus]|uniref:N-acetylglucosaminyldiphosphoundecaprenol N-acetyl-beta-D-mannosaminyltransferase n=1 Tax=Dyadobacter psychrophilus TaxID=651661 RepID=A0A1T5HCK6_9BACT|nr:WecB/TagA/CpsF family glycosyltransferase [Dyadobacter psychrophilus]SKC18423.1 N-acetylglucosaminyldiphosphoundecaprenol N-acetyl-beta-D-mannosaminyltransferase [Dyadobacter psychrophilus]